MNPLKMLAIALIVGGAMALAYGGFSYTKDSTAMKLGNVELSIRETKTINIPLWAGVAALGFGVLLLLVGNRK